jgi:hypothetical protein
MDPLTALSLVANVVEYIDFAGKVFSIGKEIHQAGASSRIVDLEVVVNDLSGLNRKLKNDLEQFGAQLDEDDRVSMLA